MKTYTAGFRKLAAWQRAYELALAIYSHTSHFPSDERFGMTSQLRRAGASIGAQIAEGSRMKTPAHRKIFYERAYASACEVDFFLQLALDLKYLTAAEHEILLKLLNRSSFLLWRLTNSLEKKAPPTLPA